MGSKKAPKPSKEQNRLATAQADAMYDQMAFNREQFGWMKGLADRQQALGEETYAWQRGLAEDAKARSDKYDALYDATTGKQIQAFSDGVDAYDTGAERDRIAGRAMVDIESAMEQGRAGMGRDMAARGLNAGSPAAIAAMMDANLQGALAKGSAATMAQEAARREGLQLRAQAAGLGSNNGAMAGSSLGQASAFDTSGLAGSGAGLAGANTAVGAHNQGQNTAIGWGNSANSTYNSLWQQNAARSQSGGLSGLGGLVGGVAGSFLGPIGTQLGAMAGNAVFK